MTQQAYPLEWPEGWPRHKGDRDSDSRFKGPTYQWDRVCRGGSDTLMAELNVAFDEAKRELHT